jgi:N-acetylglucosamine-6-phosphate deacetylase
MASYNPCKLLGIKNKGSIEIGKDADLILLDVNLNLKATFVGGKQLY